MNHRKTDRPLASFYIFKDSQKPGASKVTFSRLFGHVNLPDSPGSLGLAGAGKGGVGGGCALSHQRAMMQKWPGTQQKWLPVWGT